MIYILSSDFDYSTSRVMDWLGYFNKEYIRITNLLELKTPLHIFLDKERPENNNFKIGTYESNSIWYRKIKNFKEINDRDYREYYKDENSRLAGSLCPSTGKKKIIGTPFTIDVNKISILINAQQRGLNIPETIITNSKKDLLKFFTINKKIITKPISEIITIRNESNVLINYTKLVDAAFIRSLPEFFLSSLFQKFIEKEYEIRMFYFEGKLYPMAIFSQSSNKTKVDFRKYDFASPSRTILCKLPKDIEEKLIKFMKEEKFEASSIDMLKSISGDYYFLEVNPYGSFGMVSEPCNYYLEKKIAEAL